MHSRFDVDKAIEAILYVAKRIDDPTSHKIAKVFYFADRKHLDRYGRFIAGDTYIAMRYGPVPSGVYDLLKQARGDQPLCNSEHIRNLLSVHGAYHVSVMRDADLDYFSDSDIECLDESIKENNPLSFGELTKKSHDEVYDTADLDDSIPLEAFVKYSSTPTSLHQYLTDLTP